MSKDGDYFNQPRNRVSGAEVHGILSSAKEERKERFQELARLEGKLTADATEYLTGKLWPAERWEGRAPVIESLHFNTAANTIDCHISAGRKTIDAITQAKSAGGITDLKKTSITPFRASEPVQGISIDMKTFSDKKVELYFRLYEKMVEEKKAQADCNESQKTFLLALLREKDTQHIEEWLNDWYSDIAVIPEGQDILLFFRLNNSNISHDFIEESVSERHEILKDNDQSQEGKGSLVTVKINYENLHSGQKNAADKVIENYATLEGKRRLVNLITQSVWQEERGTSK